MGQPKSETPGDPVPQAKTLFFTEGDDVALLVIRMGNRYRKRAVDVGSPQEAMDWCLGHGAGLEFMRAEPDLRRN